MLAILLSPIYILVNYYILKWLIEWMGACHKYFKKKFIRTTIIIIYSFFASAILIGFLLPYGRVSRFFKSIGNYWLGVLLYVGLVVLIADGIRRILYLSKKIPKKKIHNRKIFVKVGTICIVLITVISVSGALNARIIRTTKYDIVIDKQVKKLDSLKIVMVADLHLGINVGCSHMEQMVKKINRENPDIVVIAGDIFDNEYKALDNPKKLIQIFRKIKSKYGVYAVYGNHDIEEKILAGFTFQSKNEKVTSNIKMDELLEKSNITLLRDEYVLIDDTFYLYGRPDYKKLGRGIEKRKTPEEITKEMDQEKPIIVLDHQPVELEELAASGVDLDLSGHTHDGQLFPANLLLKMLYENSYGYLKVDDMHSIVTSGVGLFGPNMRVATKAEITSIRIHFTKK